MVMSSQGSYCFLDSPWDVISDVFCSPFLPTHLPLVSFGLSPGELSMCPYPRDPLASMFSSPPHKLLLVQEFSSFLSVKEGHITQINSSCFLPNPLLLSYVLLFHKAPWILKPKSQKRTLPLSFHVLQ